MTNILYNTLLRKEILFGYQYSWQGSYSLGGRGSRESKQLAKCLITIEITDDNLNKQKLFTLTDCAMVSNKVKVLNVNLSIYRPLDSCTGQAHDLTSYAAATSSSIHSA